ncbi:MAG: pyruvate dehydrogenase (acetyl-transferring) E1 component subunit alpha [Bacilli bacterium]|jgi:pyruvate dehydrogenase E1 component alpha subunit
MIISKYDPLKKERFQVLNPDGRLLDPKNEPKVDEETLLKMYRTMVLARIADVKALQYQRQGRMLTYAPVQGQEAAQVGAMAVLEKQDWLAPAFREFAAMLYRGVTLEQLYLYWYGNERGSKFDDGVNVLPVNIPIGSQINHAAGLAYASKIQNKNQVAVTYIGDGGTSHGEFYEGMNFASVFQLPMVAIVQNNQYAISTPRRQATRAETLAQKAIAFGIPGLQVDGNDVLAMYAATKEAVERARQGKGPTLIEAFTYRMGPHTTSDDPSIYRTETEVEEWRQKDPIKRFKAYLINKKLWSEDQDLKLTEELEQYVGDTFKKVENSDNPTIDEVFDYTFAENPSDLVRQKEQYMKYLKQAFLSSLKATSKENRQLKEE